MMKNGMCWEKLGKEIHIDHIIPCCSFDLVNEEKQDEEIRKLANAFNSFYILNHNNVSKNTVNRQKNKINRVLENTYLSRKNNMRPQNGGTKK